MKFLHSIYLNIVFSLGIMTYFIVLLYNNIHLLKYISDLNLSFPDSNIYFTIVSILIIILYNFSLLVTSIFSIKNNNNARNLAIFSNKFSIIITGIFTMIYAIIVIGKIFSGYIAIDFIGYIIFLILFTLGFFQSRNIFNKLKNEKYLENINLKSMSLVLTIYIVIFAIIGGIYSRDLDIYDIPENYFTEYEVNISSGNFILLPELKISNELKNLSNTYLSELEESISILKTLKNNPELITELENITLNNTNIIFENIGNYDSHVYSNYISLVKIQSLYANYQLSLGNNQKTVEILQNIVENNQRLFETSPSLINMLVYITTQQIFFTTIENNNSLLSKENIKNILNNIHTISSKEIFKNALNHELIISHKHTAFIPSIPLILNINEMNDIYKYYIYITLKNKGDNIKDFIIQPKLSRKNYFGIFMMKNSAPTYTSQYKKLELLEEKIKKYKN